MNRKAYSPYVAGNLSINKRLNEEAGFSIRGLAGPCVVVGTNFAPGTSAADIQSAMEVVGGAMQSCRIVTSSPTVIAEMVFLDKSGADRVISTFNNKKVGQGAWFENEALM